MSKAGIYFLICYNGESGLPEVYIGEADILAERLPNHIDNDFWSEILVFVAQDESLDKAGVRYIESIIVQRALQDKQSDVKNVNSPGLKILSEANQAVMNEFIEDIVFLLKVLGYTIIRLNYQEEQKGIPRLAINR